MKDPIRWDNLTSKEIGLLAQENAIVIIPMGSTEQHGPHLPVGTDAILAEWFSHRTAEALRTQGIPAVITPTFAVANSMHHMSFPGTVSLHPGTFLKELKDICSAIAAHGFRRIAIINGHGGNTAPALTGLVDINLELGFPVYFMEYMDGTDEKPFLESQECMLHACESETSLMLAYDESLVDPVYKTTKGYPGYTTEAEDRGFLKTFHRQETHTENGVMGNSYLATKEKGERLAKAATERLAGTLSDPRIWGLSV